MLLDKFSNEEQIKKTLPPWAKSAIFLAVVWLVMNIGGAVYMSLSKNVYFWDSATYWDISRKIASGALGEGFWASVYNSIGEQDYNYIAGLPGALWVRIFGESRSAYVMGLINMYLMPSFAIIYALASRLSKGKKTASVLTLLLMPALVFMAFIGFADVGGVLPCLGCMYLYFTRNERKCEVWRYIAIGVLIVTAMLWRRWYAFFGVSFITAMAADSLIFRTRKLPAVISVLTVGAILLLCFRSFVFDKLLADYGSLYSGYKFAVSTDLKLVTRYFGILTLVLLAAGSIAAGVVRKEKRTVFLWLQILVCFAMFVSVQTHGQQHLLLYVPALAVMALLLIKYVDRVWMLAVLVLAAVLNTVNVQLPRKQPGNIQEIKHYAFVPDFSMRPIVREDIDELLRLKLMLDGAVEEGKTLGVLASSFALNEDILRNIEPSVGIENARVDYIYPLPQVDSRDKDMTALYNVNYMLVAFPAQTHLAPENQRVVTEAVQSFSAYADFATAYDEMPEYETELDGITVKLYKRNRMVTEQQMIMFEKRVER